MVQRRVSLYDRAKRKTGEARRLVQIALSRRGSPTQPLTLFDGRGFCAGAMKKFEEELKGQSSLSLREIVAEMNCREKLFSSRHKEGYSQAFAAIQRSLFGGDSLA